MWITLLWMWAIGIVTSLFVTVLVGASQSYFTLANPTARNVQKGFRKEIDDSFGFVLFACAIWPALAVIGTCWGVGHLCLVGLKRLLYRFTEEGQEAAREANH